MRSHNLERQGRRAEARSVRVDGSWRCATGSASSQQWLRFFSLASRKRASKKEENEKIIQILEALEEDDDVQKTFINCNFVME